MWIFLALFSRLLWSGCNAVDQMVTRAHPHHKTQAALGLQQCIELPIGLVLLLCAGVPEVAALGWIVLGVAAQCAALLPYYKGLEKEEAYNIVPYMEMTPVFVTVMALLFRGEQMTAPQGIGAFLIIGGGFLFSWDFSRGHFRRGIFLLMALCSFFFAATQLALRMAEVPGAGPWGVTGAFLVGQGISGLLLLTFRPVVRRTVVDTLKATRGGTAALGLFSNLLGCCALAALLRSYTLAPTMGHAAGLSGVQPFFSFLLAAILGRMLPAQFERVAFDRQTKAKLLLLFVILAGVWLLARG